MNTQAIQLLFNYNDWANARILDTATQLAPEQFSAPVLDGANLRDILAAEQVWRMRYQEGISATQLPSGRDYPTLNALQQAWQTETEARSAYLATLADTDLQAPVQDVNTKGHTFSQPLWQILAHVVNHGTEGRSDQIPLREAGIPSLLLIWKGANEDNRPPTRSPMRMALKPRRVEMWRQRVFPHVR